MDDDTAEIDAQIAQLEALKAKKLAKAAAARERQEREDAKVLVGSTPTKLKLKAPNSEKDAALPSRPAQPVFTKAPRPPRQSLPDVPLKPTASNMSSSLAAMRRSAAGSDGKNTSFTRSTSFVRPSQPQAGPSRPKQSKGSEDELEVYTPEGQVERDTDSLAIIEKLQMGPREFGRDPEGEHVWRDLEPNSGIRLSKRVLPHDIVQDHLRARYYLPPSLLYSVIRLSRDGATYDVPVDGDWITIAVVAERSEVRVSGTKDADDTGANSSDSENEGGTAKTTMGNLAQRRKKEKPKARKRTPRKYINLKLCSMPPRSHTKSASGPSGDAMLQLLLFEADAVVLEKNDEGEEVKSYRGGSGGAYEKWCNLAVGSVVAILNARVLRPLRAGKGAPHPLTLPLALNPNSADAVMLIGHSRDLGCCSAIQRDGNRCSTWVDLRQSQVCEYHVHAAVQRGRAGRAEFTASTSSFALSTRPNNAFAGAKPSKANFSSKTGLLPGNGPQAAPRGLDNGGGGATYLVGSGVVRTGAGSDSSSLRRFGDEHLSEKLGSKRAERTRRKAEEKEAEAALGRLLEQDSKGTTGAKYLSAMKAMPGRKRAREEKDDGEVAEAKKKPFSAEAIKLIGFDPTRHLGGMGDEDQAKRMASIALLKEKDRPVKLGKIAGPRVPSVRPPAWALERKHEYKPAVAVEGSDDMVDLE